MGSKTAEKGWEKDSSTYWLVVLEAARRNSNFELAARARHELKRLGVTIIYSRKRGDSHD